MTRFVFLKLAVALALLCGFSGVASAQIAGGGLGWAPETVKPAAVKPNTAKPNTAVKAKKPVKPVVKDVVVDAKAAFQTPEIVKALPRLGTNFKVLAPADKNYNAYAYAIGVTDQWINVPTGAAESPYSDMDQHLSQAGYERIEALDVSLRRGVQKVVVYGTLKPDGDVDQISSVVVQMPDGTWSSKIGGMGVIGFAKLEQLMGPTYGRPIAVYERQVARGNSYTTR